MWLLSSTSATITETIVKFIAGRGQQGCVAPQGATETLHKAADEQWAIGWQNFMEGKISSTWEQAHQEHLDSVSSLRLASNWTADLVSHLLEFTHALWTTRNATLHWKDADGLPVAKGITLREDITAQYTMGKDHLTPDGLKLMEIPLQTLLKKTARYKKAWLRSMEQE